MNKWGLLSNILLSSTTSPWLTRQLRAFDLRVCNFEKTGRGIQTTKDRYANDVVLSVEKDLALTATSLLEQYPDQLRRAAQLSVELKNVKLTDEQILAAGLILLREDKDPFATSLPSKQYSSFILPESLRMCLPVTYQKLVKATQEYARDLHSSINLLLENDKVSLDDFLWAFATVRSRSVGFGDGNDEKNLIKCGGGGELRVMLPGFDLLNHKYESQSFLEFSNGEYTLKSLDEYRTGDEVFISYGEHRDNLGTLLTYGFCLMNNTEAAAFWDVDDLLQACHAARPTFFTRVVQHQLKGLIAKVGNELALFAYDGKKRRPRACLVDGINMMAEIEKQFVTEPDTSFAEDVLNCLIKSRLEELCICQQMASQVNLDDEGWAPMLRSIEVLLQEEETYLQ